MRLRRDHDGLVTHDELDWAPLSGSEAAFLNLMTSRLEPVEPELLDLAARRIQAGDWPWSFFCFPEERPRPVFPSSFLALAPGREEVGLAVQCPSCSQDDGEPRQPAPRGRALLQRPPGGGRRARLRGRPLGDGRRPPGGLFSAGFDASRRDLAA